MRTHSLRRGAVAAVLPAVLLSGCAVSISGFPSPGADVPTDVSVEEQPIAGAVPGNPVDDAARDAFADLAEFWEQTFPETFGGPWVPLAGTLNSVDPGDADPADYPEGLTCGLGVQEVAQNAYYCGEPDFPNSDGITYDRAFMGELAADYGQYLPSMVMAHEYGHAVQARYRGSPQASINAETQADCFAGSFSRWVIDGNATHTALRAPELDRALQGFLLIRDPVGTDPREQGAHGSFFDRVSGFQEGYDGGAEACRDAFGDGQRVFTQASFSDLELAQQDPGNAAYPNTVDFTVTSLEEVWSGAFTALFGETFTAPAVVPFDGSPPDCGDLDADDLDLGYCPDDQTVYFDETDLTVPAYELGDFAVATAISLPYADAAREQLGLTGNDDEATRSTVCLSGWYAAQIYNGEVTDLSLSPGDLDEAISFLLAYGRDPSVLPDTELSGFELVDSYRSGFFPGAVACDVGL